MNIITSMLLFTLNFLLRFNYISEEFMYSITLIGQIKLHVTLEITHVQNL